MATFLFPYVFSISKKSKIRKSKKNQIFKNTGRHNVLKKIPKSAKMPCIICNIVVQDTLKCLYDTVNRGREKKSPLFITCCNPLSPRVKADHLGQIWLVHPWPCRLIRTNRVRDWTAWVNPMISHRPHDHLDGKFYLYQMSEVASDVPSTRLSCYF